MRHTLWIIRLGTPVLIVLAIDEYYERSLMIAIKPDEVSSLFKANLGVRQGGPFLFKAYISGISGLIEKMLEKMLNFRRNNHY